MEAVGRPFGMTLPFLHRERKKREGRVREKEAAFRRQRGRVEQVVFFFHRRRASRTLGPPSFAEGKHLAGGREIEAIFPQARVQGDWQRVFSVPFLRREKEGA